MASNQPREGSYMGESIFDNQAIDLVLASTSPRRKQLFEQEKLRFRVLSAHVDETLDADLRARPFDAVQKLAEKKAHAVVNAILADENYRGFLVVVGADTMVARAGKCLASLRPFPMQRVCFARCLAHRITCTRACRCGIALQANTRAIFHLRIVVLRTQRALPLDSLAALTLKRILQRVNRLIKRVRMEFKAVLLSSWSSLTACAPRWLAFLWSVFCANLLMLCSA